MTGDPQGPPMKVGESIGDLAAGLFCSWAILAALYERHEPAADASSTSAWSTRWWRSAPTAVAQWMFGETPPDSHRQPPPAVDALRRVPGARRSRRDLRVERNAVPRLAAMYGPRRNSRLIRASQAMSCAPEIRTVLAAMMQNWLAPLAVAEAVRRLNAAGVPASPIEEPARVFAGTHVAERQLLSTIRHPRLGRSRNGAAGAFQRTAAGPAASGAGLSARTIEPCSRRWLNLPAEEIDRLSGRSGDSRRRLVTSA